MKWTKEEHNYLVQLKQKGLTWRMISEEMTMKFGKRFSREKVKARWLRNRHLINEEPTYKESLVINSDGSQISDKLVKLSEKEKKDPEYILVAHGYDPKKWEVTNVKASMWHYRDRESENAKISYATQLAVKPKKVHFDIGEVIESAKLKPYRVSVQPVKQGKNLLEVSLFDTHFGISDYEYYKPTQNKILNTITSKAWKEILFTIGQDMLHNNDFKGQTANGTQIETVDMNKAWEDAAKFYEPMITEALKHTETVCIYYSPGNHDETITWAFVKYLKARFPQVKFDDRMEQRKIHTFHNIFIGLTHGDKEKNKELHDIFIAQFPVEWGKAKTREIHKGHFHVEDSKDIYGTMVRTLATRNKTDKWHKTKGFIGAHKRFMLFEYSKDALEGIYYV
jgi:hypothetical protein